MATVVEENEISRFGVSWTDWAKSSHFPNTSFQFWISGYINDDNRNGFTLCAVIDAKDEGEVWKRVSKHFKRLEQRFCRKTESIEWKPGDRFPDFENRT
jgi:hypothetical protein